MKIGLVNDMPMAVEAMRRVLLTAPQHTVAWTAAHGAEAVQRCAENRPDIILMDIFMPVMDGVEATRRIMAATPCAILVVTADVDGTRGRVFDALGAGALDAVSTPRLVGPGGEVGAAALLAKIELIGRLVGPTRWNAPWGRAPANCAGGWDKTDWLFAIGASAGGPAALADVLKTFPVNIPASIVVVQHLDAGFAASLATWLGQQIALPVRLAQAGDAPERGVVLLPKCSDHLVLTATGRLAYTPDPVSYVYRPSVDALLQSVAAHWRINAAGVILTGMGRDGAQGLKRMREMGFPTMAQDKATSAVYGMPKAAAELGAAAQILPLSQIGPALQRLLAPTSGFSSP